MTKKKQNKVETLDATEPGTPAVYAVPGEVAIALNNGRSQFIDGLVKRVRAGHVLDQVQVIGMLELIRDWTDARYADDRRNVIVRENLAASVTGMRELRVQISQLVGDLNDTVSAAHRVATRHGAGPLNTEDETE